MSNASTISSNYQNFNREKSAGYIRKPVYRILPEARVRIIFLGPGSQSFLKLKPNKILRWKIHFEKDYI